jgi:hypothetical protein
MAQKVYVITREAEIGSCYSWAGMSYTLHDMTSAIFDTIEKAKAYLETIELKSYISYEEEAEIKRTDLSIEVYNGIGDIYRWIIKEMEVQ